MKSFINLSEVKILTSFIGARFEWLGGVWLPELLVSNSVTICTDAGAFVIEGHNQVLTFEGFEDEYSSLRVSKEIPQHLDQIRKSGNTYLRNLAGNIQSVAVVREKITEFSGSQENWTYEKDIAIVFKLDSKMIALSLVSHGSDPLKVKLLDSLADSEFQFPAEHWDEDLFTSYKREIQIIDLNDDFQKNFHE